MPALTPRELVRRTLRFEPTPRISRNLWVLPWAERHHPDALAAIRRDFPDDIALADVPYPPVPGMHGDPHAVGTHVDEWGCRFVNLQAGVIGEVKEPLVRNYDDDLDKVRPPDEWHQVDLAPVADQCADDDRFMIGQANIRLFERMQFLRGTVDLFVDLLRKPAGLFALRDRVHQWNLAMIDRWAATDVDAIAWMDDWGAQRSTLIDPDLWREFFKPCYRQYVQRIHAAGKFCFVHSDGWITDLLDDVIEIGIDAINAQLFCMDVEELARRFKRRITFWGEIDRQHLLPFGSPDEIRQAVRRVANGFCDGHGGVIAQCEFGAGAKPENVRTVFEEWNRVSEQAPPAAGKY